MTTPKKVLIVRFSSIGDIVLCSPVTRCVKEQWGAEVHFITKHQHASIIAASPYIDKTITIHHKVAEAKDTLLREKYDLVIDLHKNIRSQQVRAICKTRYVTFDKINLKKWLAVHTPINLLPKTHLVDRYFEGLKSTGLLYDGKGLDHHVSAIDIESAKTLVPEEYAVLSLGATYHTKRPPIDKLAHMMQSMKTHPVLIGGADVVDMAMELTALAKRPTTNLVGKVSLAVSSAVVRSAQFVVTGDSGMMHIAAAHGRPLIVFWGSTHPMLGMYPYYPSNSNITYHPIVQNLSCQPCSKIGKDECPKGHFRCMRGISDPSLTQAIHKIEG